MAELLDSALGYSDDAARMGELQQSCGLESVDVAASAYRIATPLVMDELAKLASQPQSARTLLRVARSMKQSDQHDPNMYFKTTDASGIDNLIGDVFGSDTPEVVDSVGAATGMTSTKALGLVQAVTGVIISIAAGDPGDAMTLDLLTTPIRNERHGDTLASAGVAVGSVPAAAVMAGAAPTVATNTIDAVSKPTTEIPVVDPHSGGGRSKAWMLAPIPVLLLAGIGLFVATGGSDESAESVAVADGTSASETTSADDSADDGQADPGADAVETAPAADQSATDGSPTDGSPTDESVADESVADESAGDTSPEGATEVVSPPGPPGAPENYSILSGGKLFLRGKVPSSEVEGAIVAAVTQILGPGNVISEYEIDPDDPFEEGRETVVFVDETVLFATGSTEIAPDFLPVLGLGLTLLQIQEGVQLEVIGHTDSLGGAVENLALSQGRVDAVKAFFVSQGIDADRVIATGKGETEPRADNSTPEGRQANRRVEFIVSGFQFS